MDEQAIGLIQRAAARLKQQAARPESEASVALLSRKEPPSSPPSGKPGGAKPVLTSRTITVNRERLTTAGISFPANDRSRLAEEFRVIKRGVLNIADQMTPDSRSRVGGKLILVTSARPLEGKTFVAANLALALASERECRALVVDCDSATQSMSKVLGVASEPGFGDWLAGDKTDIAQILLRTNIENFSVIPAGQAHANIPEMLSSKRVRALFEEMARRYADRYIVLDAPPCLAASDATILAPLVGQIVFVVEAFRTQREEVDESLRLLRTCPHIALVLNKSEGGISEQFGSYSNSYYRDSSMNDAR